MCVKQSYKLDPESMETIRALESRRGPGLCAARTLLRAPEAL